MNRDLKDNTYTIFKHYDGTKDNPQPGDSERHYTSLENIIGSIKLSEQVLNTIKGVFISYKKNGGPIPEMILGYQGQIKNDDAKIFFFDLRWNIMPAKPSDNQNKTTPITHAEIIKKKKETIPDQVIEVFNELIAERWDGHSSCFKQEESVEKIIEVMGVSRNEIFGKHWIDIEDIYRDAGWDVDYESYAANFTFTKK